VARCRAQSASITAVAALVPMARRETTSEVFTVES